jgi:hypothetical protein
VGVMAMRALVTHDSKRRITESWKPPTPRAAKAFASLLVSNHAVGCPSRTVAVRWSSSKSISCSIHGGFIALTVGILQLAAPRGPHCMRVSVQAYCEGPLRLWDVFSSCEAPGPCDMALKCRPYLQWSSAVKLLPTTLLGLPGNTTVLLDGSWLSSSRSCPVSARGVGPVGQFVFLAAARLFSSSCVLLEGESHWASWNSHLI